MASKPTGGAAFPLVFTMAAGSIGPNGGTIHKTEQHIMTGATLRDYFAAKAMQGFISNTDYLSLGGNPFLKTASMAYSMADAMLLERDKS